MDRKSGGKSRRELRKEGRITKNQKKFDSWVQHQQSRKSKKSELDSDLDNEQKLRGDNQKRNDENKGALEKPQMVEASTAKTKKMKTLEKNNGKKRSKSKFQEYLEMEMGGRNTGAKEDQRLEKELAKKLKGKNGKLRGENDDIDMLLEGLPSFLDNLGEESPDNTLRKKSKRKRNHSVSEDKIKSYEVDEGSDLHDGSSEDHGNAEAVVSSKDMKKRKRKKTKPEDIELERKLAKELKVKGGKLGDNENKQNLEEAQMGNIKGSKKKRAVQQQQESDRGVEATIGVSKAENTSASKVPEKATGKYVAPHLRPRTANESEEHAQIRKRLRGLLNRLSESNVESITGEISTIVQSVGRNVGSQIVIEEVVVSCSDGPRGNEQYAAVFAAFVAGIACLVGIDFGAKLLVRVANCFEEEYLEEDNLSLRNLTLLLCYLYIFGVCSSELMYDFLLMLSKRLTEVDVSTVLTVLQSCGMKLRADDPVGMKNFILSVQNRVNELKTSSENGDPQFTGKRMEFMLETICDIKNNRKRAKEDTVQHTRIKKWLQKLRVDDILLRGLKWSKLLDNKKKGQWWLSGDIVSATDNIEEVAGAIDREITETRKMLELAAAQRMNTDARRAIFCVIMSGEDYIDAFEKLLRLDLPGKQDREIMRVLVECCLQEEVFNKYYCVLASKLCNHDKNHKFTLQYCLWDHFKELESFSLIRSMHLSKFVAEMVSSFTLSLAVLKVVDFDDATWLSMKKIMHFRMLFEAILGFSDKLIWNIFTRIAVTPEYESLRHGIEFFIRTYVISSQSSLEKKFKIAKKALNNVEGVIM